RVERHAGRGEGDGRGIPANQFHAISGEVVMSAMASGIKEPRGVDAIRKVAMRFPGTQEGISCNKVAFNAGKKAFLFIGVGEASYDAMLKLGDSRPEAAALAAREPERCKVGGTGWVT